MSTLQRRRGFTLLEVLIASLLASTLLVALWGLLGIYSQLFESGKAKTEQSQLARAILQQLNDDLRSAIQDSTAKPQPGVTRRFGLFGSRQSLRLDVLQVAPEQAFPPSEDSAPTDEDKTAPHQVPELRTVEYAFVDPTLASEETLPEPSDGETSEVRPGLTRRELDFETPDPRREDSRDRSGASKSAPVAGDNDRAQDDPSAEEEVDDPSITWLPEVVGLEFRYFDGRGWTGSWDSLRRRSLPVAVEVKIEVESFDPRDLRRRAADEGSLDAKVTTVGTEESDVVESDVSDAGDTEPSLRGRRVYRLVVGLPTAASYRGAKGEQSDVPPTEERLFVPTTPRQPRLPMPESRGVETPVVPRSDQWMRTDSP